MLLQCSELAIDSEPTVQCTAYSVQCTVYSIQCTVYSVQCTVYSVQCTVYSVQCTVYSVQYAVYRLLTALFLPYKTLNMLDIIKGKSVPLQARSGPDGSRKLFFPDYVTMVQNGGKVVSLTYRPPLAPQEILLVLISVRGWSTQGLQCDRKDFMSLKNSNVGHNIKMQFT